MRKVFISSVIAEYSEFRAAAKKTVQTMNLHAVMAEDFGARPMSPQAACMEGVRESDIYVGIFGRRYSEPTREEFEEARRIGKDILIFLENVERDSEQDKFVKEMGHFQEGYHRATFSTEDELREVIIKSISKLLTTPPADYDASDTEMKQIPNLVLDRKEGQANQSWFWLALVPSPPQTILSARKLGDAGFQEELVDLTFRREFRLFNRRFGTDTRRSQGWIEAIQRNADRHSSPPVRYLMTDRRATFVHGQIISEEADSSNDYFRSHFIDPNKVADICERFLKCAAQFYDEIDSALLITAFSFAAYIAGVDRYFEKPPEGPIQSISMPWSMSQSEDIFVVPDPPFHIRRNHLRDGNLAEEITALFREKFERPS